MEPLVIFLTPSFCALSSRTTQMNTYMCVYSMYIHYMILPPGVALKAAVPPVLHSITLLQLQPPQLLQGNSWAIAASTIVARV